MLITSVDLGLVVHKLFFSLKASVGVCSSPSTLQILANPVLITCTLHRQGKEVTMIGHSQLKDEHLCAMHTIKIQKVIPTGFLSWICEYKYTVQSNCNCTAISLLLSLVVL